MDEAHQDLDSDQVFGVLPVVDVCLQDGDAVEAVRSGQALCGADICRYTQMEDMIRPMMLHPRASFTLASWSAGVSVGAEQEAVGVDGE